MFTQKTAQSGKVTICSQDHITYLPKWALGRKKQPKKKKISLFIHEIFIFFVMSIEFCPAINSSNSKEKNNPLLVCNAENNTNISLCLQVSILGEMLAGEEERIKIPSEKYSLLCIIPSLQAPEFRLCN